MSGAPGPVVCVRRLSRRFRVAILSDRILKIAQFVRDVEPAIVQAEAVKLAQRPSVECAVDRFIELSWIDGFEGVLFGLGQIDIAHALSFFRREAMAGALARGAVCQGCRPRR